MDDVHEITRQGTELGVTLSKRPVSPEWQKDCKRNASGIMAVAFTAGFAWITASHTFVALSDGRLAHPSTFGWPLYACIFVFIVGIYTYIASERENLPMPGRKYVPVDHSARGSLWYETMTANWAVPNGGSSDQMTASVSIVFTNGASTPIVVQMEEVSVSIESISLTCPGADRVQFTLLPNKSRTIQSTAIDQIPSGASQGEVFYSATYGLMITGSPRYRRTHRFSFHMSKPVTPAMVINNNFKDISVTTHDIESQVDTDVS